MAQIEPSMEEFSKNQDAIEVEIESVDSSDEEELRNHVGNIPMHWYDEFDHIGYSIEGKKIERSKEKDSIDKFIEKNVDPDSYRRLADGKLIDDDVSSIVERITSGNYPSLSFDPFENYVEWCSNDILQTPLKSAPIPKKNFRPSLEEKRTVRKIMWKIIQGKMKVGKPIKRSAYSKFVIYDPWRSNERSGQMNRPKAFWPAPKIPLPKTGQSYNPPADLKYSLDEIRAGKHLEASQVNMRGIESYKHYTKERFDRCLDLYLCPRERTHLSKLPTDPDKLLPKLPKAHELRPYPSREWSVFKAHTAAVISISVHSSGDYLASSSAANELILWKIDDSFPFCTQRFESSITHIEWCPSVSFSSGKLSLLVAMGTRVYILKTTISYVALSSTSKLEQDLAEMPKDHSDDSFNNFLDQSIIQDGNFTWRRQNIHQNWDFVSDLIELETNSKIIKAHWHPNGDYFLTLLQQSVNSYQIYVHQFSQTKSKTPFSKNLNMIVDVVFHPNQPHIVIANHQSVRIYDLKNRCHIKTLKSGVNTISALAVHPGGDNIVISCYDQRIIWFDLDLSVRPYQRLRVHKKSVNAVTFHQKLPLLATCSDDSSSVAIHAKVFNDFTKNALIVPVKINRGDHNAGLPLKCCQFHPSQHWLFVGGDDGIIRMFY